MDVFIYALATVGFLAAAGLIIVILVEFFSRMGKAHEHNVGFGHYGNYPDIDDEVKSLRAFIGELAQRVTTLELRK